jgi:predicted pyridoxine 5'-phosphate oxidase superfamily flavin-nucleotide-binding protein
VTTEDELWHLVATQRQGILTTLKKDGRPQLSNVLYKVDESGPLIQISTTADRAKARNLGRDPRASLHVSGENFWQFSGPKRLLASQTWPPPPATRPLPNCSKSTPPSTAASPTRTHFSQR